MTTNSSDMQSVFEADEIEAVHVQTAPPTRPMLWGQPPPKSSQLAPED